ncbi:MAG: hypothetical protein AAGC99_07225 [Pseudomonadota bacterium]
MPNDIIRCITPLALAGTFITALPLAAEDLSNLSETERKQLLGAYVEIDAIDQLVPVCDEIAPSYSSANQAAMAEFIEARSIDRARALVNDYIAWQKAADAKSAATVELTLGLTRKAIRASIEGTPEKCRESFRAEIFDSEFKSLAALVETYGLDRRGADVADAAQATVEAEAPAVPAKRPAAEPVQPVAAAPTGALGMPAPIGDRVEALPGITWQAIDGVRSTKSGGAYCVWRCVALEYDNGDFNFPQLVVHEAVPLGADQAIDQMLALTDAYNVLEQQQLDSAGYASRMAMQPDGLAIRNVLAQRHGDADRHVLFALEKNGLTTIAELHYSEDRRVSEEAQEALTYTITQLQMDEAIIKTSLAENPGGMTAEAAKGAPPAAGQVIFAETPNSSINALTLSLSYDDDVRYLDKAVLDKDGPVVDMDDSTYYYVPPQPDGATIEGVFTSSNGYAGVGISVLKSKTLVFNRNGRYTTSASSGVVGGFLASTGSGSEGEGSYRINGYTLELQSDDGTVQSDLFFPYMSRTFWPGNDGPADEVNFINLGGKILYRDDG